VSVKKEDWILVVVIAAIVLGVDFLVRSRWSPARLFFKSLERAQADAFRYGPGDLLRAILRVVCWMAFLVASAVLIALLAGVGPPSEVGIGPIILAILLWMALVIVVLMIFVRYRQMERRAMLWSLAVAAEKGIPLASAVRAFAEERRDGLGYRARLLAESLEQGVPLDQALEQSFMLLPNDAMVAVHTGCQTGTLASMLRSVVRNAATLDAAVHAAVARVVYLVTFIFFAAYLNVFLALRIIPAFQRIFQDFKISLPPVTVALIRVFSVFREYPVLAVVILVGLLMALLYAVGRYVGLVRWDPPLVRAMSLPLDEALLLRALAESVGQERSLTATIEVLARQYPKPHIRRRLVSAAAQMDRGAHWCDSLESSGLLPSAEAGVLRAAERVGNLVWAMNEMADRLTRKFTTRLTAVLSVGFPVVLLLFAGVVFLVAVGLFFPLAHLISHLA